MLELPKGSSFINPLIVEARRALLAIQRQAIPISETSCALEAFDARISRHLHSIIPLKPISLPSQEEIWVALNSFLDGWEQISKLSACESLITWLVRGLLSFVLAFLNDFISQTTSEVRGSSQRLMRSRIAYLRSTAQVGNVSHLLMQQN